MSPGAGGGGGNPTGTVPKTKAHECRREALNHVSNNLLGLDWQSHTYDRRTRKNLPLPVVMDDGAGSHDNRCLYAAPDSAQWSSPGRAAQDNGVACDKNNISKTAERSEVVSRLNQICDYIKQTSYLMDTLKNSDSNLVELDSNCSSARGSASLSRASSQGRHQSELLQGCDRDELRIKVEESQRKLQALQEHQAALAALQDKAKQQLVEARQEQSALMAHCAEGEDADDAAKLQQLQQRLQSLAEMCHSRNQLAVQLGETDAVDELLPEQLMLQDKLQQLQCKKQHMDHLVSAALHNNTAPGLSRDDAVARDKVAELNVMKQQLAHLKQLVASVETNKELSDAASEEQAVNLRRQNVRGSSAGEELSVDVQARTLRLQDAQGRLQQLQDLVSLVGDAHASGRTLPDQYVDTLLRDSASPLRDLDKNTASDKDSYPALREKKTNSQSQRQLLALELQAKRLQLEALMSKDHGLPAVNQDKPGYSEATIWGDDHSLCYSSEEGAEEEEDGEPFPGLQLSASVLAQSSASNRDALDMSLSLDTAPSPHPLPPVSVPWTVPQETPAVVQTADYPPASNVWKPPLVQQGDAQPQGNWGMMYSPLPGDSYYQQLLATSQIQQQNMMLTMLNQCCQLLWLQQRDLQGLRSAVHSLQERASVPTSEPADPSRYGLFLPPQEEVPLNNCFPQTPALNNQVAPGNRANNYWDNFRSYSRQNLLSNSASKSNEGLAVTSHSPSPLVERSHNTLQAPVLSLGAAALPLQPDHSPQSLAGGRKETLNADQSQRAGSVNQRSDANTTAVKKKRHPNPKITSMPPRNTHKSSKGPVSEEVAALISANESRPDFLLHLFKQLRSMHSESHNQARQPRHISPPDITDDIKMNGFKTVSCAATDWMFPNLQSDSTPAFCPVSNDELEDVDGAAAIVPEPLPRNAAWKMKDLLTASPDLQLVAQGQGHGGRVECRVESVVAELRPLLHAHRDDTCTPALMETVRRAAARLLPQTDSYCCSQLDAQLRDALVHFQHCRLGSIAEQLLAVVAEVLQTELTFLQQAGQLCAPLSPVSTSTECAEGREAGAPLLAQTAATSAQAGLTPDAYNGDLAEADQSCHTDNSCCEPEAGLETAAVAVCAETDTGGEEAADDGVPGRCSTPGAESL